MKPSIRGWAPAGAVLIEDTDTPELRHGWNRGRPPQPLSPSATDLPSVSSVGQIHPEARWQENQLYRGSPQGQEESREEEEEKEARRMGIK